MKDTLLHEVFARDQIASLFLYSSCETRPLQKNYL